MVKRNFGQHLTNYINCNIFQQTKIYRRKLDLPLVKTETPTTSNEINNIYILEISSRNRILTNRDIPNLLKPILLLIKQQNRLY